MWKGKPIDNLTLWDGGGMDPKHADSAPKTQAPRRPLRETLTEGGSSDG